MQLDDEIITEVAQKLFYVVMQFLADRWKIMIPVVFVVGLMIAIFAPLVFGNV